MKPGSPLSDYYQSLRLNPDERDKGPALVPAEEARKRLNLLEHHLKLPSRFWGNVHMLEVGPGSGENALVLAKLGTKFTFVEPLVYCTDAIREKFNACGAQDRIAAIHHDTLEVFSTQELFDVVGAEGFVHCLKEPVPAIAKLCSWVRPEGFLILSIINPAGTFLEFVKKAFLAHMTMATDAKTAEERMECARTLFLEDFQKIPHSKIFETWILDTLLSPLYRRRAFLGLDQILQGVSGDFVLYSSWPNYLHHDDLAWHRAVKTRVEVQAEQRANYYARLPSFLHSRPQSQGEASFVSPEDGMKVAGALGDALDALDALLEAGDRRVVERVLSSLQNFQSLLRSISGAGLAANALDSCVKVFRETLGATDRRTFDEAYKNSGLLRACWGSPQHVFAFHRTELFR